MSQSASQQQRCNERLCLDSDTRTVRFPGGATREYCRAHLPAIVNMTGAEVLEDA